MLNIRVQKLGKSTVFHCVGRITSSCADLLQSHASRESHGTCLVLNLANVTAMDAAGIGALVSLQSRSKRTGRSFKLMNVNPRVESLLKLTRLKPAFEICSAREMLDLLCRAIHQTQTEIWAPTIREAGFAGQSLSPA
jgi:anti-anti-sigma factor